MTENPVEALGPGPSRPPAPEPLEIVRQFVNTFDVESGMDELGNAAAVRPGWPS